MKKNEDSAFEQFISGRRRDPDLSVLKPMPKNITDSLYATVSFKVRGSIKVSDFQYYLLYLIFIFGKGESYTLHISTAIKQLDINRSYAYRSFRDLFTKGCLIKLPDGSARLNDNIKDRFLAANPDFL